MARCRFRRLLRRLGVPARYFFRCQVYDLAYHFNRPKVVDIELLPGETNAGAFVRALEAELDRVRDGLK